MNDSEPLLPRDLNDFQAALAGVMPNPDRLSAEQIWFRAGCDAERRRAAASAGRHPRWFRSPIASLAAGIAAGLALAWLGDLMRGSAVRTEPTSIVPIASHDSTDDAAEGSTDEARSAAATASIVRDASSRPRIAPGIAFDRSAFAETEVPESPWMRRVLEATSDRRLETNFMPSETTGIGTPVSLPRVLEPSSPSERLREQRRLIEQGLFDDLL